MFFLSPKKLTRMQTFCMKLSPTLATLHPNTSGLLFIFFYKLLRALILFENLVFLEGLYSTMGGENFEFMVFKLLKNAFSSQKSGTMHLYSCLPWQNSSPGSYHHRPGRENLLLLRATCF